jgi:DNA modification methylase
MKIKLNPNNPRIIKDDKFKKLVQSIKDFPEMLDIRPIVVNKEGIILGGNMRYKACIEAGIKEPPHVVVDLTDEQQKEFLIKDNVSGGEWDWEALASEWDVERLDSWGLDMPSVEVEQLEAEEDDFEAPEGGIETDIVLGDLFEIGEHRLLCGDSTDSDAVARLMNGSKFDILVTSPPYNQGNGSGDLLTNGKKEVRLYDDKNADNKSKLEYYDFLISILNIAFIFKNDIHSICWNVSYNAKSRDDYGKIIFSKDNPFTVHETIIWDKGHSINLPQVGIYSRRCEFVFIMSDYDKYLTSQTYNDCRWNVWNISSNKSQTTGEQTEHRAAYPIEFASKMINDFSLIGNLIYEPFTGSGTTMVASHQLNRKCYGMELDPKYCQVIIDRMKKLDPSLVIKRNGIEIK